MASSPHDAFSESIDEGLLSNPIRKKRKIANRRQPLRRTISPENGDDSRARDASRDETEARTDADEVFSVIRPRKQPIKNPAVAVEIPDENDPTMSRPGRPDGDISGLSSRFAPSAIACTQQMDNHQTHINKYIDSHLNKPYSLNSLEYESLGLVGKSEVSSKAPATKISSPAAIQGKLLEVTPTSPSTQDQPVKKPKLPPKIRVNRYGKVFAPRQRRRNERSGEDVDRDQRVEDMLAGTGLSSRPTDGHSMKGAEDEKRVDDEAFAEEFRREYLENSAATGGPRSAAGKSGEGKAAGIGPKMGGSRNQRNMATRGR